MPLEANLDIFVKFKGWAAGDLYMDGYGTENEKYSYRL